MKPIKAALVVAMGLSVSGCATMDVATRNAPFMGGKEQQFYNQPLAVQGITVNVSQDLRVSEAEVFYPVADIVWRGDLRGDRYEQVGAIFEASAKAATQDFTQGQSAIVEIDVLRFHSVTNRARYSIGGNHSITFMLSVVDPATGLELMPSRKIKTDLKAFGGEEAAAADARGETQKKRVSVHLTRVIRKELSATAAPEESVSRNQQITTSLAPEASFDRLY
ncbi:DUF6778 family protein [Lentibacter sp.]|uniref:DUF6778 family protein n=1 Tax=Lentibacter sp. TaxID=2024994 RepID=UPI003F6A3137